MNKLILLILFSLSSTKIFSSEVLDLPVAKNWVKNIFPKSLPHELRSLWLYNYAKSGAKGRVYFFESSKQFCAYLGNDRKYPSLPNKKNKTLRININCFNDVDRDDINSEKNTHAPSSLKKDLISAAVSQWGLNERAMYKDEKLKNCLFEHDFFDSPWSLGVDIDGPHYLIDFYSKAIYEYLSNREFWQTEPYIYGFIRDNIYNREEFFYSTYDRNTNRYNQTYIQKLAKKDKQFAHANIMYIRDGNKALWARFDLIEKAKKSITISYFSYFSDISGHGISGLLLKKLKEGVKVRLLVDVRGSLMSIRNDYMQELVAHGAEVKAYNPIFATKTFFSRFKKNGFLKGIASSMHDKILLVDNKYLITGGRNICDKYFVQDGEYAGRVFTDLDIAVEFDRYPTSVIKAFTYEFYSEHASSVRSDLFGNWVSRENELLGAAWALKDRFYNQTLNPYTIKNYPILKKYKSLYGKANFQIKWDVEDVPVVGLDNTSSFGQVQQITNTILPMLRNAKEIYIQNPYLVLTPEMESALRWASSRGAKIIVSVTSPLSTDSWATQAFLVYDWKRIMEKIPGVEFHAFLGPTQLHAKLFVIDRKYTAIGSYNMDFMSQDINSEFSLLINSPTFAQLVIDDVKTFIGEKSFTYDNKKNIGPESIPNVSEALDKTMRFFWLYKYFKNII